MERGKYGRFAAGNGGGPGRPRKKQPVGTDMRPVFADFDDEDWRVLIRMQQLSKKYPDIAWTFDGHKSACATWRQDGNDLALCRVQMDELGNIAVEDVPVSFILQAIQFDYRDRDRPFEREGDEEEWQ